MGMEFLPEDPAKRKTTLIALGVLVVAVVGVFAWQFWGGESAPSSTEAPIVDLTTPQPPPETPQVGTPRTGGKAKFEGK